MALTSLFTAVSGMNANSTALSVISDNVANMNTTGFKASRAAFGDILSQQIGDSQVGRGVLLKIPQMCSIWLLTATGCL
jgi:flagellar hook protein FlgE